MCATFKCCSSLILVQLRKLLVIMSFFLQQHLVNGSAVPVANLAPMTVILGSSLGGHHRSSQWGRGGEEAHRTSSGRRKWHWGYGSSCMTQPPPPAPSCHRQGRSGPVSGNEALPTQQPERTGAMHLQVCKVSLIHLKAIMF